MPIFGATHPQHPTNRCLRFHAAVTLLQQEGALPEDAVFSAAGFRREVLIACGAGGREQAIRLMGHMEELGLIEWEKGDGPGKGTVRVMPAEARERILAVPA